jgi:hypothetical protein
MPAQYRFVRDFGYPVAEVYEAIVSPDCWLLRANGYGVECEVTSRRRYAAGDSDIELLFRIRAERLPRAMRPMAPEGLDIVCRDHWVRSDEGAAGLTDLVMADLPVEQRNETRLAATGPTTCRVRISGEVRAAVPFAGRAIEQKIADHYRQVLDSDFQVLSEWIDAMELRESTDPGDSNAILSAAVERPLA